MNDEYLLQVALELRDDLSRNMANTNRELENLKKQLKSASSGTDELGNVAKRNAAEMKKSFESIARTSKIALGALTAAGIGSVKAFSDMEYGIKKVQTISSKSFEDIKKGARELAKTYGANMGDILEANYDMVSAMGDITESHRVMDQAAQLSMAGFTSLGGAVNALSGVMNAYKMEATEVTKVSDVLMTIQNRGVTNIEQLQASLSTVIPTAASLGIRFEDIAAAMATMTSNKIPTAQATTQIRAALAELAKEGTSASKAFKQLTGESFIEFINKGGDLGQAFEIISIGAEKSGKTLYDVFGSVEAAGAVINLTGINLQKMRENQDAVALSAGTTKKASKEMIDTFKVQFNILRETLKQAAGTIGEQLTPKLREAIEAVKKIKFDEVFSEKNINNAISLATTLGTIAGVIWSIEKAIAAAKIAQVAFNLAASMNPYILAGAAIAATIGGTVYLFDKARDAMKQSTVDGAKISQDVSLLKGELEKVKGILDGNGFGNSFDDLSEIASIIKDLQGTETLKNLLAEGDIEKAREELNRLITDLSNKEIEIGVKLKEDEEAAASYTKKLLASLNRKAIARNQIGELGTIGDDKEEKDTPEKRRLEDLKKLIVEYGNLDTVLSKKQVIFDMNELEKAEAKFKEVESTINSALDLKMDDNQLEPILREYETLRKKIAEIKENIKADKVVAEFQEEFESLNLKLEIFGADEEERLLETIRVLESQVSKAIAEGMIGNATELGKKLKEIKDKYKDTYEEPEKQQKEFEDSLRSLGQSVYQVSDLVGGKFQTAISAMINGLSTMMNSLKLLGAGNSLSGLADNQMLKDAAGYLGIAAAVGGIVSSFMSSSDDKRKQKNQEQERKFEENTNALQELGERLKQTTSAMADLTMNLIASIARSPTLHRIAGGENILKSMEEVLMNNKDFGTLSFLAKESKKTWYGKKKNYSKDRVMSESTLMSLLGYDPNTLVNDMDLDQLKKFRDDLNRITEATIKDWANTLTDRKVESVDMSAFEQYKKNIDEFIKSIELLQKEQKELFRNATLEGFEGINILDEKQLVEQYTQMFEDMGIAVEEYKDIIEELVSANKVAITSMEDVRSAFIDSLLSGEADFASSMGSYFQKILKNAAMVVYDTLYSEVDEYFSDMFEKMADKLVSMKESGKIDFTGFWNDFDFGKILEAQNIQSNFEILVDDLRKQLEAMGISDKIINSMLPATALSEKVTEIKGMISSAMSTALTDNDFNSFEKSLGQSIYNSVKDSLVKAFAESEAYKKYIDKYFNTADFEKQLEGITDPKEAFELMQKYMENLNKQLEAAGMGVDNTVAGNKTEDKYLGNSYYSEGATEINIHITQNFSGVYGEDTMYKIAKEGAVDALNEAGKQSKILGAI